MANWTDLKKFVSANYKIGDDQGDGLMLEFGFEQGRSQRVFLFLCSNEILGEWVAVQSPFGVEGKVDLLGALRRVSDAMCGGVILVDNLLVFRHCAPLADLSPDEITRPIELVCGIADELEKQFGDGGDRF